MHGINIPFLDKLSDLMGYYAYVVFEDLTVFLGGLFIGAIGVILIASRWYRFGGLSEKHGKLFSAVKVEDKGEDFSRILVRKPDSYMESVDGTISILSLLLFRRHHSRRSDRRSKFMLYLLLFILFIAFVLAILMIFHFANPEYRAT